MLNHREGSHGISSSTSYSAFTVPHLRFGGGANVCRNKTGNGLSLISYDGHRAPSGVHIRRSEKFFIEINLNIYEKKRNQKNALAEEKFRARAEEEKKSFRFNTQTSTPERGPQPASVQHFFPFACSSSSMLTFISSLRVSSRSHLDSSGISFCCIFLFRSSSLECETWQ